jgi:hypothetical protein
LKLVQEPHHGENVFLDLKTKIVIVKKYFENKVRIQGHVLVTQARVDINLLKLAQQPNHGKNVLIDPKTKTVTMKKYFENKVTICM